MRPIFIDGSNVAMSFGRHRTYDLEGILICVRYFLERGYDVFTFVPNSIISRYSDLSQSYKNTLHWMAKERLLSFTPSRKIFCNGKKKTMKCYDDLFVINCAFEFGGAIVSNDQFRDVIAMHPELSSIILKRSRDCSGHRATHSISFACQYFLLRELFNCDICDPFDDAH
ncbi:unnamed protein product [Soboliphyme baturini]|uniref:RNase_Zc3h12a domain-containing protein n=1 Tax=Soboliphyme baturini TaxID=241478 RepID=A0A183IU20_9BILA|nr:unnamed protein product [Soboliphyme baturini]